MTKDELKQFCDRALVAFDEGRFDDEASIWEQVVAAFPDQHQFLCNLASARANQGRLEEAVELFFVVIERDPALSRAHNNLAAALMAMGADVQQLVPAFAAALETSEDEAEFGRHFVNLCNAAAYGPDRDGRVLLDEIERRMTEIVSERCPEDLQRDFLLQYGAIVDGWRYIADFRSGLARRRWSESLSAIESAEQTLHDAGLDNFARGARELRSYLEAARQVFELVERIGCGAVDAATARDRLGELRGAVATLRLKEPRSFLGRFVDVLGWFVTLLQHEADYLASDVVHYEHIDDETQLLIWLTSSSFRELGGDLISLLNMGDRLCREIMAAIERTADRAAANQIKVDAWVRLTLFLNGLVLDFRGLDVELARRALKWQQDPVGRIRAELVDFRNFVERQAFRDIFVDSRPQESIARALLQARLRGRSYREVPARGGRTDVLVFVDGDRRILIETKIWRGAEYYEQGLREVDEYVKGEGDDGQLLGAFYVVFDPTKNQRAIAHVGSAIGTRRVGTLDISVLVINLRPPSPSRAENNG